MNRQNPKSIQARNRVECLIGLEAGVITVLEVLQYAQSLEGKDLRALTLREVLRHAKGVNANVIEKRLTSYGLKNVARIRLTWILDDSKRLAMVVDALTATVREAPSPSWPFVNDD